MLATQKCLMASFEDRNMLSDQDLQLIKKLGLAFRGKNAWPQFRDYTPTYMPWYLTSEQARFLTLALQQAVEVSLQMRDDLEALEPPADDMCMVRVPHKDEKGEHVVRWLDAWITFPVSEHAKADVREVKIPDERLRTLATFQHKGTWEIGFFFTPTPVKDKGERPYIPYVMLWVDHATGFIFHVELTKAEEYEALLVEGSLRVMKGLERVPEKVLVGREKEGVVRVVEGVASQLGIKVVQVEKLREVEKARKSMVRHFSTE